MNKHEFDVNRFIEDAYMLNAIYASSRSFSEAEVFSADEMDRHPVSRNWDGIHEGIERAHIPRLLVSLALTLRIKHDDGSWIINSEFKVGELIRDTNDTEHKVDLTLIAACNKIIHAVGVDYDRVFLKDSGSFLSPSVHLTGKRDGKNWHAKLNIYRFTGCCINVVF